MGAVANHYIRWACASAQGRGGESGSDEAQENHVDHCAWQRNSDPYSAQSSFARLLLVSSLIPLLQAWLVTTHHYVSRILAKPRPVAAT